MTALLICLGVLLLLFLLSRLRVGVLAAYGDEGVRVEILAGPIRVTLLPRPEKAEKPKKEKKTSKKAEQKEPAPAEGKGKGAAGEPQEKKPGALEQFRAYLPLILEAVKALTETLRLDPFQLHVIWGLSDPAMAAMGFGAANAALGIIWPLLDHTFHIPDPDLGVAMDFDRPYPAVTCRAGATLTVGQVLVVGVRLLRLLPRRPKKDKAQTKQKEGNLHA